MNKTDSEYVIEYSLFSPNNASALSKILINSRKMQNNVHTAIAGSELIITERGTIYHLDIAPEHLAPTIITVGSPDRVKEVSKYFDRITHTAQHREFITHTGYIGGKQLSVVSTGIGSGNIDIVFNELDALVNIDFGTRIIKQKHTSLSIVRLGTCGTLQEHIPVDSLIVSTHGIGLDNLLLYYNHETNQDEAFILSELLKHTGLGAKNIHPYLTVASEPLRKHFSDGYIHGMTATCPGFYGPQARSLRLAPAFPNLLDDLATFVCYGAGIANFEMETAAMYGMGTLLGHNCLSISTAVANRATKTFSGNADKAVDQMIRRSLEVITNIL